MADPSFGKLCTGPIHDNPVYLPVTEEFWYFHKTGPNKGKPVSRCRSCINADKLKNPHGDHGWVPTEKVFPLMKELVQRCDNNMSVAAEYAGLGEATVGGILKRHQARVQKQTVRKLVLALYEKRKEDRRNGSNESFRKSKREQAIREHNMLSLTGY